MATELHLLLSLFSHSHHFPWFLFLWGTCKFLHRLHSKMNDCCRGCCTFLLRLTHTYRLSPELLSFWGPPLWITSFIDSWFSSSISILRPRFHQELANFFTEFIQRWMIVVVVVAFPSPSCPSVSGALELLRRSSSLMATEQLLSSIPRPASTPP